MKALRSLEISEEPEVSPDSAVHVELDVGPIGDQATRLFQLCRGQPVIKLHDSAIRLQRPERVAESLDHPAIVGQEAPTTHGRTLNVGPCATVMRYRSLATGYRALWQRAAKFRTMRQPAMNPRTISRTSTGRTRHAAALRT